MIIIQFLELDNTMILIRTIFIIKLVIKIFAATTFTVDFNKVKNITTGIFWKTVSPKDIYLAIQEVFVRFLNKLKEDNDF